MQYNRKLRKIESEMFWATKIVWETEAKWE